eukprot:1160248-Pelagomonas_calceolata.AAC.2
MGCAAEIRLLHRGNRTVGWVHRRDVWVVKRCERCWMAAAQRQSYRCLSFVVVRPGLGGLAALLALFMFEPSASAYLSKLMAVPNHASACMRRIRSSLPDWGVI